jgi:hypothetical protein
VTNDIPISDHRLERILAYMVASAVGLSIISFLAVIIASGVGVTAEQFSQPPWPTVIVLPVIGLPIGVAVLIALLLISSIRRGREARNASR